MIRGSGRPIARHASSSRAVRLDLEDSHRSRAAWVEPALFAVTPRNRGANLEVPIDVSTASCKHSAIRLPRPSAPLQSITATTSRLCSRPRSRSGKPDQVLVRYRHRPLPHGKPCVVQSIQRPASRSRLCTVGAFGPVVARRSASTDLNVLRLFLRARRSDRSLRGGPSARHGQSRSLPVACYGPLTRK